jgi:hypothetical protein
MGQSLVASNVRTIRIGIARGDDGAKDVPNRIAVGRSCLADLEVHQPLPVCTAPGRTTLHVSLHELSPRYALLQAAERLAQDVIVAVKGYGQTLRDLRHWSDGDHR